MHLIILNFIRRTYMMRHEGKHRHDITMLKNIQRYEIWHMQYTQYKYTYKMRNKYYFQANN